MSLYAIGDLHFSLNNPKPMDIFGEGWKNHTEKIVKNWENTVKEGDTVLLAGDISWGIDIEDSAKDMELISSLPGRKIIVSGNHDYWFASVSKLKKAFPGIMFLKNNHYSYEDYAICGSRGWICPGHDGFSKDDDKIYKREQIRLGLSINNALNAGFKKIIVLLHFPPTNDKKEASGFISVIEKTGVVEKVVYGHLHGEHAFGAGLKGRHYGADFYLVSADYIDFSLFKLL